MNTIFPLLAALIGAGDTLYEKYIFDHKKQKSKIFVPALFIFAFIILIIFFYPFIDNKIDTRAFTETLPLILLFSVVAIASARNMLYYYSFQKESLCDIEPFVVLAPLFTIIFAGIIYPDERNIYIFILAVFAGLTLVWSHIEKKHLVFSHALLPMFAVIILEAVENIMVKELLYYYSPVSMYTVRVGLMSLVLYLFYRPKLFSLSKKDFKNLFLISFFWVLVMIFYYYGYELVGIVYTTLISMLAPVLVVLGSFLFLKDKKIQKKDIIALVVIITCVIIAQFIE